MFGNLIRFVWKLDHFELDLESLDFFGFFFSYLKIELMIRKVRILACWLKLRTELFFINYWLQKGIGSRWLKIITIFDLTIFCFSWWQIVRDELRLLLVSYLCINISKYRSKAPI